VHLPGFLGDEAVAALCAEARSVQPAVHRSHIPRHKKGGSVGAHALRERAPGIVALYESPALVAFLAAVTGRRLLGCPPADPHACALYYYTEPGDHIGFHYDTSYYRGERFTVLVGLVERSSSRLVCELHRRTPERPPVRLELRTDPGSLVLFNGDRLWHSVSPLGRDEERVSLSLEYVTDPAMSPARRFVSNMKDAIAYFGFRSVFGRGPRGRDGRAR
jgi:alkylated DNA repair dioxygenase AlkB